MRSETKLYLKDGEEALNLLGLEDSHLRFLEERLSCQIVVRGEEMTVSGETLQAKQAEAVLEQLLTLIRKGNRLSLADITYVVSRMEEGSEHDMSASLTRVIATTQRGRPIKAKTLGQAKYVKSIEKDSLVFGIGPAGTGKTYLAVVTAVKALRAKEVNRIVLTRPAVEAGGVMVL